MEARTSYSPRKNKHKITPIPKIEIANPQTPFLNQYPTLFKPSNNKPMKQGAFTTINHDFNSHSNEKVQETISARNRTARLCQAINDKNHQYENYIESFFHASLKGNMEDELERLFQAQIDAVTVIYWSDIPNLQVLQSDRLKKMVSHTEGIVGHVFFTRETLNIENPSLHPQFQSSIDSLAGSGNSPMIYFPLWDSNNTVCAVVQIVGENPFDDEALDFIQFFIQKFKLYSSLLLQAKIPNEVLLELLQIMEIEQFLLLFQKKIPELFKCSSAEIWSKDLTSQEVIQYQRAKKIIKDQQIGIVGEAFRKKILVTYSNSKMASSYSERFDGFDPGSILVLPVMDEVQNIQYAIVLRNKKDIPVFDTYDEDLLCLISPYVILSFTNIKKYSDKMSSSHSNVVEHNCVKSLINIADAILEGKPALTVSNMLMETIESLTSSDRSSLFLMDDASKKLKTQFATGMKSQIVAPPNRGILGITFIEKQTINVPDAYEDIRFDSTVDLESGYRTRSLLSVPLITHNNTSFGAIQLLNKLDGKPFSKNDIDLLKIVQVQTAICFENEMLSNNYDEVNHELKSIISASKALEVVSTTKRLLTSIMDEAKNMTHASNGSLFLVDDVLNHLVTYITDSTSFPTTLPLSQGIAAAVVKKHESVIVNDPYHDPRFNKIPDFHSGFKTKSILAIPILAPKSNISQTRVSIGNESKVNNNDQDKDTRKIIGVIELINKQDNNFTEADAGLVTIFAAYAAVTLESRRLKNIAEHGIAAVEMGKWLGEIERKSFIVPNKLQLSNQKQSELASLSFFGFDWNGIGLFKIVFCIFHQFGLLEKYNIHNDLFFTFLYKLRNMYNDIPYHNWIHAIDVLQYCYYIVKKSSLQDILTNNELLSLCIAAMAHDVGHEGFDNSYNLRSETPNGILYKDLSVMEMHHCSVLISIIDQDESNIFHALPENDLKIVWKIIITLILATDNDSQNNILRRAKDIMDVGPINLTNDAHRIMVLTLIIKAADLSNTSRPFEYAEKWAEMLFEENYKQGDMEDSANMEHSSPTNDRLSNNKAKNEKIFYDTYSLPLFQMIGRILPDLSEAYDAVKNNREKWNEMLNQTSQQEQIS